MNILYEIRIPFLKHVFDWYGFRNLYMCRMYIARYDVRILYL